MGAHIVKQSGLCPFSVIFRHGSKKSCQIFGTADQPVVIHFGELLQGIVSQAHHCRVSEHPALVQMRWINIFPIFEIFAPNPVCLLQSSIFFLCKIAENFQSTRMVRIISKLSVIFRSHEWKIFCITQEKGFLIFQQFPSVRIAGFTTEKMIARDERLGQIRILLPVFPKRGIQIRILKINLRKNFVPIQFTHQRKHAHCGIIARHDLQIPAGILPDRSWAWRRHGCN